MAGTVGNKRDEVHILAFLTSKQTVNGIDDHLDDVDVFPFVETADVVGLGDYSLMENEVNGTCMVLNEQPVANILTLAIDGKRLTMTDVVDEQRNQFLGELIGTVVVGAVGYDDRHAVGVVVGTYKMVARCLGS